jgi:hypothetical protein
MVCKKEEERCRDGGDAIHDALDLIGIRRIQEEPSDMTIPADARDGAPIASWPSSDATAKPRGRGMA